MQHALTTTAIAITVLFAMSHTCTATAAPDDDVRIEPKAGGMVAKVAGREVLQYRSEPGGLPDAPGYGPEFLRGGYINAVFSPAGVLVSDDYPPDHKHHHGIWSPWTKTKFEGRDVDFWNMGQKKGKVEPVSVGDVWHKPGSAGFTANHRMVDLTAPGGSKTAIDERWDVTVYAAKSGEPPAHVFDLVITQTTASDSPLELPKYHYGGLGLRGARQWNGADKLRIVTSEGETDRVKANETRTRWSHVGGDVDGKPAGIAILCHPDNFRFPQPIRIHPKEPFFCYAPSQLGDWRIEPGKPYVAKYRFVVTDGNADPKQIETWWQAYAKPEVK